MCYCFITASDGHYNISGRSFQIPSWQDAQKNLSEDFPYLYQVVFKELKGIFFLLFWNNILNTDKLSYLEE